MADDGRIADGIVATETGSPTEDLPRGILVAGQVLGGRYEVRSMLGRGGMGEVWRAFDLKLRVEVALKAMRADWLESEHRRELLRREVRAAREVVSPNVCRIFDLIEVEDRELVSMEYIDGSTLLDVLRAHSPLELEQAQDIASQFLAGLEAIHAAGLVHRDVKPENIMLTRVGRVVVMDFGLARGEAEDEGTVSGTPAYMAPEQAAGGELDARADVYAAGVVLAEMVAPEGVRDRRSRSSVWEGLRSEPPRVPDSPWAAVIRRAVARDRAQRPRTARTLIRELEDVTLRVAGAEDLTPYPGLASFTEADAEYFFGREAEVEAMWVRLEGPARLLGLVGPSGAGKTSFLCAGVMPAAPVGWSVLRCTPGTAPAEALRHALAPALDGDTDALAEIASDKETATVTGYARWRAAHAHALLVVDQFEELFTLNPDPGQESFAELLHRLPLEADVHVVLSMRDDFLMECHRREALRPIIADLMLLDPPVGSSLRRALVQPGTRCGYRFEDDTLVEAMLAEVEGERGALPLLAFAAAQLWERRNREGGLLTRDAYETIGGVGGALARHAELTVDRVGSGRLPLVRELFRNLVTAEGTRAVRDADELLSVFGDQQREAAGDALRALVDARLLTTYEIHEDEREPTRRVEIIHESLLANWPRLVRWQTQDADAAQLRDQLRQAAHTWDEHTRSDDLLWTGAAYREFAVWRESYPGGLTEIEVAFAAAMARHAARRRRRRRVTVAVVMAVAAAVAAVTTTLWRRGVIETRRAQATTLLFKAQSDIQEQRSFQWAEPFSNASNERALPYATASLELWDQPAARRTILRVLRLAPPMRLAPPWGHTNRVDFSPDGRWMAGLETFDPRRLHLVSSVGGESICWEAYSDNPESERMGVWLWFVSDAVVATFAAQDPVFRLWSVPGGELLETLSPAQLERSDNPQDSWRNVGTWLRLIRFEPTATGSFEQDTRGFDQIARFGPVGNHAAALDPTGDRLAYVHGSGLFVEELGDPRPLRLGSIDAPVQHVTWSAAGDRIATWQPVEGMRVWSLTGGASRGESVWRPPEELDLHWLTFDHSGTFLAAAKPGTAVYVWDLLGPPDAEPWEWSRSKSASSFSVAFHPTAPWLAASYPNGVVLWPVERGRYPYVLHGHRGAVREVAFGPDGSWLVSASEDGTVRWWPLTPAAGAASRVLFDWGEPWDMDPIPAHAPHFIAVAPDGAWVAVVGYRLESLAVVPVAGGEPQRLHSGGEAPFAAVAVDPTGRWVAAGLGLYHQQGVILIWDLQTDEVRRVAVGGRLWDLQFLPDGSLLDAVSREGELSSRCWDIETLDSRPFDKPHGAVRLRLSVDGRYFLRQRSEGPETDDGHPQLVLRDLVTGTDTTLPQFDGRRFAGKKIALSPSGALAVVQDPGVLMVGRSAGGEPHRIVVDDLWSVAISPDERWIAIGQGDGDVLLWPVPDLECPPLDNRPQHELTTRLKSLTNFRAVRDDQSADGWGIEWEPFPGWEDIPEW